MRHVRRQLRQALEIPPPRGALLPKLPFQGLPPVQLWNEENQSGNAEAADEAGLRNVGVTTSGLQSDLDDLSPDVGGDTDGPDIEANPDTVGAGPESPPGGGTEI